MDISVCIYMWVSIFNMFQVIFSKPNCYAPQFVRVLFLVSIICVVSQFQKTWFLEVLEDIKLTVFCFLNCNPMFQPFRCWKIFRAVDILRSIHPSSSFSRFYLRYPSFYSCPASIRHYQVHQLEVYLSEVQKTSQKYNSNFSRFCGRCNYI